jgi:hypothetical protein
VRLSELVAALSFSSDLALGQPMEHVLRSCLIALRLADHLVVGRAGSEPSAAARMRAAAGIAVTGGKSLEARFLAHCAVTRQVSRRIGLPVGVGEALSHTFVRWDGKGVPRRIASKDVPMSVRLMQLADFAEVHHRLHGIEGAVGMTRRRAGKLLWPELVKTFCEAAPELLRDLDETTWDQVIAAEPSPRPPLTEQEFDSVLEVVADIADLKSPWLSGHSRGVADLAARAVQAAGVRSATSSPPGGRGWCTTWGAPPSATASGTSARR